MPTNPSAATVDFVPSPRTITDRMIRSRHARVRWLGWLFRIRRYVAFDWSRGPWPK